MIKNEKENDNNGGISYGNDFCNGVSAMASSTVTTTTTETTTPQGERPERMGKTAKVTAVDGKKITVTLQAEPEATTDTTTPPEKPEGTDTTTPPTRPEGTDSTTPPEKPSDDDATGAMTPPNGAQGGMEMAFDGDEATITITSDVSVKTMKDGAMVELTYSDIAVDDILMIEYAEDGETITSVTVRGDEMPQGQKPEKTTTDTTTN